MSDESFRLSSTQWRPRTLLAAALSSLVPLTLASTLASTQPSTAQGRSFAWETFEVDARVARELWLAADLDDDDEDGLADGEAASPPGLFDSVEVRLHGRGAARVHARGPLRLIDANHAPRSQLDVRLPATIHVQGTAPGEASIEVGPASSSAAAATLPVHVFQLFFESPSGAIDARTDAVAPTLALPNDRDLPRAEGECSDPRCLRLVALAPAEAAFRFGYVERLGDQPHSLPLQLTHDGERWTSPWIRLVVDTTDERAPGVSGRVLRVALRDVVRARVGYATQSVRVGRPGDEDGPLAARQGRLRIRVVRHAEVPSVGTDDAGALALATEQLTIANEIWLQCLVGFEGDVAVVDTPPDALLAVADVDGMSAAGGQVRFRAAEVEVGPIPIAEGTTPIDTAVQLAGALRDAGFEADVRANPRTAGGADQSADVVVRRNGELVALTPVAGTPLSTDARQSLRIGHVDLSDGLRPFSNSNAAAGSLEERTLLHGVADSDPHTIDMIIINGFTNGGRQGEAFIESDRGAFSNVLFLDRSGIRQQRAAWTQSHELGHVLLDMPFHPDDLGADRPWLLMDADSSSPYVTGPKRLTTEECARARHRSGVHTWPVLLDRLPGRGRATEGATNR